MARKILFSEVEKQLIIEKYKNKETISLISKQFNISHQTVTRLLEKENIALPGIRKYSCNDTYFKQICTEENAYWLGFLAADGGVIKNTLILKLAIKDLYQIEKFNKNIQSTNPIRYCYDKKTNNNYPYVQITSKTLIKNLSSYGIVPRKTWSFSFPENIPNNLIKHFIRGYFDGDGCWRTNKKTEKYGFSICSANTMILKGIQSHLIINCNLNLTKISKSGNTFDLCYSGNKQTSRIAHFLYDDATIFMDRKKQKIEQLLFPYSI
jgi:intein-encoded DNA endonuclease-like protein